MHDKLSPYIKANFAPVEEIKLADSHWEDYAIPSTNPLRDLLRCTQECAQVYGAKSTLDTATMLLEILHRLGPDGIPAHAFIPLFWPTLTDFGQGNSSSHNRTTYDTDPVVVSPAPPQAIFESITSTVSEFVDRRNSVPPFDEFTTDIATSIWPEIDPFVRLNQILYHPVRPKPIVEFHPLSTCLDQPEEVLENFMSRYSPFFIGALGLPVTHVTATRNTVDQTSYYWNSTLDPRYDVSQTTFLIKPQTPNDWNIYLTNHSPRPRLTVLGPRIALAAAVGSINKPEAIGIDSETKRAIRQAMAQHGETHRPRITSKIAGLSEKIKGTQYWYDYENKAGKKIPDYPVPTLPFSSQLVDVVTSHLQDLGYENFL